MPIPINPREIEEYKITNSKEFLLIGAPKPVFGAVGKLRLLFVIVVPAVVVVVPLEFDDVGITVTN